MLRTTALPILASALALSSCTTADPQANRPFAGQGAVQSLDQAPTAGSPSFINPLPPGAQGAIDPALAAQAAAAGIDPRTLPPQANLAPPANIPAPSVPPVAPPPGLVMPPVATNGNVAPNAGNPANPAGVPADGVPVARPVPGRPGFVFSPRDPNRQINVEGLKSGTKAKDQGTGEIFRVP